MQHNGAALGRVGHLCLAAYFQIIPIIYYFRIFELFRLITQQLFLCRQPERCKFLRNASQRYECGFEWNEFG